jgi:hypothetical protein
MNNSRRFVELKFNKSNITLLIALEDIVSVVEELRSETKGSEEYKAIRITTIHRETHLCDYSCYAMLNHYLCSWDDVPSYIEMGLKDKNT